MSSRKSFYFRERVTHDELNSAFDDLENADRNQAADLGFVGVVANAVVSPHASVPNLTVDVSGPGIAIDQLGRRLFFSGLQNANVAVDDNGVSTAVTASGKEKVVSVFLVFDRVLSDPRIDGNSQTVFFDADETVKFSVVQGAEADAGTAVPPALRADAILIADVTRRSGQAQIVAADISTSRRQDAFVVAGAPRAIRRGRTSEGLSDLLGFYNAHAGGSADRHAAAAIDYAGGPAWADNAANPGATVEAQLDKIVGDLAGATGAAKVGGAASSGSPGSLAAGSVRSQLDALLGQLNGHITNATGAHAASALSYAGGPSWRDGTNNPATTVENQLDKLVTDLVADAGATRIGAAATAGSPGSLAVGSVKFQLDALLGQLNGHLTNSSGAHAATAISYAGGAAWKDGTTNPATTVEAQLDKLVADLAADAGAARIGAGARTNWLDGRANPAGVSAFAAIDKIITDLNDQTASADGARRIGAAASGTLAAGSVRSQLDALDASAARIAVANTFSAAQTVNGAAGDTNAALVTTAAPTTRKLLWEMSGAANAPKYRLYAEASSLEITVNARWTGTQWAKDVAATPASKLKLNPTDLQLLSNDAATTPFADTWANSIGLQMSGHGAQSIDVGGNWISAGATETFIAWTGPSNGSTIGSGTAFHKAFPAAPSSITFQVLNSRNLNSSLLPAFSNPQGMSATAEVVTAATSANFTARVFAS